MPIEKITLPVSSSTSGFPSAASPAIVCSSQSPAPWHRVPLSVSAALQAIFSAVPPPTKNPRSREANYLLVQRLSDLNHFLLCGLCGLCSLCRFDLFGLLRGLGWLRNRLRSFLGLHMLAMPRYLHKTAFIVFILIDRLDRNSKFLHYRIDRSDYRRAGLFNSFLHTSRLFCLCRAWWRLRCSISLRV